MLSEILPFNGGGIPAEARRRRKHIKVLGCCLTCSEQPWKTEGASSDWEGTDMTYNEEKIINSLFLFQWEIWGLFNSW